MRPKRTLRVPWLTGFITLWPCAPKRRKNAPNCVRSVQAKCRGRQKTKNKQRKIHKHSQKWPRNSQNDGKCPGVWAFLRTTNKKLQKTPSKNGGQFPPRIELKNQEKQAECAPPLPGFSGETRKILKTTPLQKTRALHPTKNNIWKSRKSARSTWSQSKNVSSPSPLRFEKIDPSTCFPTGGPSSKTYIYIYTYTCRDREEGRVRRRM